MPKAIRLFVILQIIVKTRALKVMCWDRFVGGACPFDIRPIAPAATAPTTPATRPTKFFASSFHSCFSLGRFVDKTFPKACENIFLGRVKNLFRVGLPPWGTASWPGG
jgi:hypothetical protein